LKQSWDIIFKCQFIFTGFALILTAVLLVGTGQSMILFAFYQKMRPHEYCSFVQFANKPQL